MRQKYFNEQAYIRYCGGHTKEVVTVKILTQNLLKDPQEKSPF